MEENEFANTKDHELYNDLCEYVYDNEKNLNILYYLKIMDIYNFFNKYIDIVKSIIIDDDESSQEEEFN